VSTGETLVLEPGENFFAFRFAALDFADPTQNRYRYMLEGLDEDWIDAGPSSLANYTAVRPGRYRFRVAARNADGVWNEEGLDIPVKVEAPYHRTWWFRSALLAVALLAGAWAVYRRISEHRRRFEVASRLHDGIGANIASIIRSVERIAPAVASDPVRREELGRVATLARRAQTETRAAVRILRKGKEADTVESLVSELRDTAEWMLQGSVRYQISTPEDAPRQVMDWRARTDVCLLFNEALNNVLKHAEATFVEVNVAYRPPDLHLRVADNGKGFGPGGGRGGNGLELMRQHATRHGGEVVVRSKAGEGTVLEARVRVE
jgi:signal transduction histidine kinase